MFCVHIVTQSLAYLCGIIAGSYKLGSPFKAEKRGRAVTGSSGPDTSQVETTIATNSTREEMTLSFYRTQLLQKLGRGPNLEA
jgi:hypothetical protein